MAVRLKNRVQSCDDTGKGFFLGEQVARQNAAGRQSLLASGKEVLAADTAAITVGIECVDQDQVVMGLIVGDEFGSICNDQIQTFSGFAEFEKLVGSRDDAGVDFDGGHAAGGQMPVNETDLGRGAETDDQCRLRPLVFRPKQQAGHHLLRIGEFQCPGAGETHGALHPAGAEVQIADAVSFADVDAVRHGIRDE